MTKPEPPRWSIPAPRSLASSRSSPNTICTCGRSLSPTRTSITSPAPLALKEVTGAPILYNEADLPLVAMMEVQAGWLGMPTPEVQPPDHSPTDGEILNTGNLQAHLLHTPGHTEGSLCVYMPAENLLLAGDTLFAGSVGRTDLPGGHTGKLLGSIRDRLLPLPDTTVVVPGHGGETTIGRERASNPFLR